jgi:thymidylate kinase
MPRIIADVARETGTQLFQSIDHELTGRAYFLASIYGSSEGSSLTIVQPDCASDYRHFGRLWLTADEVLRARRWHPNGFFVPSAAHEFAYYLIKRLNKRDFNRDHGYKLHRLYVEDRIECGRMIARFCKGPEGSALVRMASANDWSPMRESLPAFHKALMRSRNESLPDWLAEIPQRMLHFLRRVMQPTGCWIAFMGPDGCGKSTILNAVSREFAPAFREVRYYHMRPRVIGRKPGNQGPVTDPHGQLPRGKAASVVKVMDLLGDYLLGYLVRIRPAVMRTTLVLFDRCFYDLLVDSRRIRYGGPPWLLKVAVSLAPRPELVLLLDAPPEVLWTRKQEVPFDEVARQRTEYLNLARSLRATIVVNAAQPAQDVIHDALAAITNHLSQRTGRRLGLSAPLKGHDGTDAATSRKTW